MSERQPWTDVPLIWKDEKAYFNWLRSQIRRTWSRHPIKVQYKLDRRYKAPVGLKGKEVFVSDCEICGKQGRDHQVDHLHGGYGFKDWQTFTEWSKMILWVTFDDIQEICVECHEAVSLSQKLGISFEKALIEKEVIKICKLKASEIDKWLKEKGVTVAKNSTARRSAVREILSKG